ncbi:hypothetical protein HS088_TW21G01149 [Tripterygium wilfordii]|uniref:C2H2-type domain-containing protein n=1 Tax=Tripterygium wilfordii TaxID=458696 RepID=A0A7J7C4E6_TRIWF|nr:uncharacterized protein LOC119990108 isoform X1 [Tripterygium wilfordii]XP_038691876.1 uncharacterized protein LOC119990108 isoform X1 [Tripterygium wilfordii]KAF5728992.1 hypothetical protein HS088_TW21G01149 [Tripterygium wilfordii]
MARIWFFIKRSLRCRSDSSDAHDSRGKGNLYNNPVYEPHRSGCSRSSSNVGDVIHGSKRRTEKQQLHSPVSLVSGDILNPITNEVVLRKNSFSELKMTRLDRSGAAKEDGASSISTVKPGTPGPGGRHTVSRSNSRKVTAYSRRTHGGSPVFGGGGASTPSRRRGTLDANFHGSSGLFCQKCGEKFRKPDAVEAHFFSSHAVTELAEGDSSRRVVEIICRTGWSRTESGGCRIERILKVHSMQRTLAQFEEYRESVKIKACKLPRKHPRCVADGNELLRFYGTTIACSLGKNGSSCLCTSEKCGACHILRHGFSMNSEINGSGGIFTTSTGGRAFASIELDQEKKSLRKALLVCRVIAGRVSQSLEKFQDVAGQSGLNSVARKVRRHSNIEELFLLNPRALLPCFVIMF